MVNLKLVTVLLFGGILIPFSCSSPEPPPPPPPPEVLVVRAETRGVPITQEFVGEVAGVADIPIRARVEGFLEGIHFQEGSRVRKGQLLYTIDPQPFEAKVAQAKSRVAEAQIQAVRAQSELNRIEPLAANNAVSQSDLDAAVAEKGAADAAVEAAEAQLELARIELSYTRILSPLTGTIGKTQAKIGETVGGFGNANVLNTVSRLDSFLVEFFIPERDYLAFAKEILDKIKLRDYTPDNEKYPIRLLLADGSLYPETGTVRFADREVNPSTGTLLIQTIFPNPDRYIRPGQFAKIRTTTDYLENGILVPQRCVSEFQGLQNVYVVNDSSKVEIRQLQLGPTYNDYWIVYEGLEAGERIIYEGFQTVRNGSLVRPKEHQFVSQVTE